MSNQSAIATTEFGARSRDALVIQSKPIARVFQSNFNNMPWELTECSTWNTFANASLHRSCRKSSLVLREHSSGCRFRTAGWCFPQNVQTVPRGTLNISKCGRISWLERLASSQTGLVQRSTWNTSVVVRRAGLFNDECSNSSYVPRGTLFLWLHPSRGHFGETSHLLDNTRAILAIEGCLWP